MARLGESARRGLGPAARLAVDAAGYALGGLFAALAAARRAKGLHPYGPAFAARVTIDGATWAPAASALLSRPAEYAAIIRFSRALGLPKPLPDLLGAAVRVPDAYGPGRDQDILVTSSADRRVLRRVFLPARGFAARPYSSGVPYRAGAETFVLGLVPQGGRRFALACSPGGARFRRVGLVEVGERLPASAEGLRFHPYTTGGGLEPVGLVNRLRDYAYPLSQAAWAIRARPRTLREPMADWNAQIIDEFRANHGSVGGDFAGAPMLLLHHRGRKSGAERVSPVMYLADEADTDTVYVFASKAGAPTHPEWYRNLMAAGSGRVELGDEAYDVDVSELEGEERDRIFAEQAERYSGFAGYAEKTAGIRTIPVLALRRRR